jgi:Domain of unknown function (DUF1771)/Zinc finger C-x8-C-x5-C-x3-H type (and similar)/RNA-binding, Nab2-type zinc finger
LLTASSQVAPKEKVVCKYFIQWGECLRSDCIYSHDLTSTICRFWLRGHCLAGDTCPFSHSVTGIVEPEETKVDGKPLQVSFTEDDFPTIGQRKKKGPPLQKTVSQKPVSKFEFKPSKKFVPSYLKAHEDEFMPAIKHPEPSNKPNTPYSMPRSVSHKTIENKLAKLQLKPLKRSVLTITEPQLVPWIKEDYGINKDYVEHRVAALRFAEMRNKYLQLAAGSWHRNDGHKARALSKKGQAHNINMVEEYVKGRKLLFRQRKETGSEIYIDLHGMELDESVDKLKEMLDLVEKEETEAPRPVYAICSSGHYFTREKSADDQLSKKVKEFLDNRGYEWKEFQTTKVKFGKIIGIDTWSHI